MKKTDKKLDNAITAVLTQACDIALLQHDGFVWLTHLVNYQRFPKSLAIVCVFETNDQLAKADQDNLRALIKAQLATIDIALNNQQIHVDTEENCNNQNNGEWQERFERINNT